MSVKARDLRLDDLFSYSPSGGLLTFAGQRTLLLDAVAMGLLRQQLIELLGQHGARGVFTRFGYAHGWRTAESMRHALSWESEREWRIAGGRLHRLQGLVLFEPVEPAEGCLAMAVWRQSYEAEQHLLQLGRSEEPVCWSLSGFASGYLSHVHGKPVFAREVQCVGRGDAVCRMEARFEENWGPELTEWRVYYEQKCLDDNLETIRKALLDAQAELRTAQPGSSPEREALKAGIVARSDGMQRVVELSLRVSRVDTNVLLSGESGSGKERFARFIHNQSARVAGPFVAINCGAVPENLLESELFGHKKGSFTGATENRMGLFEAANGGTLFLDEVGEISPAMQVKLLRVLQERTVRRVGDNEDRPIDVRILAATHQDLEKAIETGDMREDFFFRLRVVELAIPPLRERREDILPLSQRFLAETLRRLDCPERRFSAEAIDWLLAYDWPGNVRELQNAIEHAVVLSRTAEIGPGDLPAEIGAGRPRPMEPAGLRAESGVGISPDLRSMAEVEREHILGVLEAVEGNRSKAAEHLGIGEATLYRRLRSYREGS